MLLLLHSVLRGGESAPSHLTIVCLLPLLLDPPSCSYLGLSLSTPTCSVGAETPTRPPRVAVINGPASHAGSSSSSVPLFPGEFPAKFRRRPLHTCALAPAEPSPQSEIGRHGVPSVKEGEKKEGTKWGDIFNYINLPASFSRFLNEE